MNDFKDNIVNPVHWIRLVFIVIYAIVLYLLFPIVLLILVILQFLSYLLTAESNDNLSHASRIFSSYVLQIINYLTFTSDEKPWPFNDIDSGHRNRDNIMHPSQDDRDE